MDRYTGVINQPITLDFKFYENSVLVDAFEIQKVEVYSDYSDAVSSTNILQTIATGDITRVDVGSYEYSIDSKETSGTYYDKIYVIPVDGEPVINYIRTFYVQENVNGMPGNAVNLEYSSDSFTNNNGVISLKGFDSSIQLYSTFDVNSNAKYALENKTATVTGTPTITAGGTFGNYIALNDSTIKYDKCNFKNGYIQNTIESRVRLDFDNAYTYVEFDRTSTTMRDLLIEKQGFSDLMFYASYNDGYNATYSLGDPAATLTGTPSYAAGGKFDKCLILSGIQYVDYDSVDNFPIQSGTINFWFKPGYSGSPANTQILFETGVALEVNKNKIQFYHATNGNMSIFIGDEGGNILTNSAFGVFTPVQNTFYNVELDFDLDNGEIRLFINGVQLGSTKNISGTRDNTSDFMSIGSLANTSALFSIDEVLVYNSIKHTANFTPSNTETSQDVPFNDNYEFKISIDGVAQDNGDDIVVPVDVTDTWDEFVTKVDASILNCVATIVNDKMRIVADNIGHSVEIFEPTDGNSLISLLDGVGQQITPNGPINDVDLFQFYNGTNNSNRVRFIHSNTGNLLLKMYDNSGVLKVNKDFGIWNSVSNVFYNIALCYNESITKFYIDGVQFGQTFDTGFSRTTNIDFIASGNATSGYGLDELIIYDTFKYIKNFTPSVNPMTEYPTNTPYIILNYGTGVYDVDNAVVDYSGTLGIIPMINNKGYYYFGGAWIESDMTYAQSVSPTVYKANVSTLPYDGTKAHKIKVFFYSDGIQNSYLTRLYLNVISAGGTTAPDYSPIIEWVRTKLGEPILPVELDNSQIEANIYESLQRYLYYRNAKEDFTIIDLNGDGATGYDIPEGWEDFYDIVFYPNSPVSGLVYSGDWGKNIYLQYYYSMVSGGGGFMSGLLTDFYLTLSAMSDASIILGFQPTWQVLNEKLYINPNPTVSVKIGLRKKRMPSVSEINADIWIRRYTLALSKITLGEVRETIAQVPVGMENIPLNGSNLKTEGIAERDRLDDEYYKRMEPLFLNFF